MNLNILKAHILETKETRGGVLGSFLALIPYDHLQIFEQFERLCVNRVGLTPDSPLTAFADHVAQEADRALIRCINLILVKMYPEVCNGEAPTLSTLLSLLNITREMSQEDMLDTISPSVWENINAKRAAKAQADEKASQAANARAAARLIETPLSSVEETQVTESGTEVVSGPGPVVEPPPAEVKKPGRSAARAKAPEPVVEPPVDPPVEDPAPPAEVIVEDVPEA